MPERLIPPEEWVPFCEHFTHKHRGWLVTLTKDQQPATEGRPGMAVSGPAAVFDTVPLRAVTVRRERNTNAVSFVVGDRESPDVHTVENVVLLQLERTHDEADRGLTIRTGKGEVVRTRFLTPHYGPAPAPRQTDLPGTNTVQPDHGRAIARSVAADRSSR